MAYQVDKFNGTFLVAVADGTIDTTTDLRFVGKNYAGYGEVQNENFLHLLENFANTSPPPKVITGQVWYDSSTKRLKFYDGSRFKVAGGAEVAPTAPSGLATGEFWWDTSSKQLYSWSGTEFVLVGPEASPDLGASSISPQVVKDNLGNSWPIVKFVVGGRVMAVLSQTESFTLGSPVPADLTDFSVIKKGFTLADTKNAEGISANNHVFWGTSSNALRFGGDLPTAYVKKGDTFDTGLVVKDDGVRVGDDSDLRLWIDGENSYIENLLGRDITVRISVSPTDKRNIAVFRSIGLTPGTDNSYTLGSPTLRWSTMYSNALSVGSITATGNITGKTVGDHKGNVVASTDETILINGTTKEIGYTDAILRGTLIGSVTGELRGDADNASKLGGKDPTINLPTLEDGITLRSDLTSIPVRSAGGDIVAVRFIGIANKADLFKIDDAHPNTDPTHRPAKTIKEANTIAARDGSGDLSAFYFRGTATAAQYADLAEKYLADKDYEVGTVLVVGGDREVTASTWGDRAIGVVSANPAFMMNSELEGGTYVALKGRVPVKVTGVVKKGQRLIAANDGTATAAVPHANDVFAIALESSDDSGVKLIEAIIL